jgi:hypothetical protein
MIRAEAQARIDELHAKIKAIISAEKAHYDATHQEVNWIERQVAHTAIEHARMSPEDRGLFRWATASLPVVGGR